MTRIRLFVMILGLMPGFITSSVFAQIPGDQLGVHDLSPAGTSPVKGSTSSACLYCHATHSALPGPPLWNQTLSVQAYTSYTSSTYHQAAIQPVVGNTSKLCLSCHDGTVAPGQTVAAGKMNMGGSMAATAKFGADLRSSHPFSMKTPLVDSPELASQLFSGSSTTRDPAVKMVKGNVECVTCHDAHFQAKDHTIGMFLVRDNLGGQLCLACHDPNRVVGGQTTNGQTNYLANWPVSIHATATNHTTNQPYVGGYNSVAENACNQCHMSHNAAGPARLLRGADEQACLACHNGGSGVSPAAPNVFAEFAKGGHPFPLGNNVHDRVESGVLNNNRHATCVDCHNPHQSMQAVALGAPPVIRPSQNGVVGVSAADGITVLNPAINQFENCLRCHGTSAGKLTDPARFGYLPSRVVSAADPLNLISEFSPSSTSSHPVTHDRRSALMQPSLRSQMLNLDGTNSTRTIGTRILCTDCHNSDDNREFGGIGPNGPHGSRFSHILERRYEFSQAASPGGLLSNLYPSPDLSINGPYAMCSKCHDLTQILANTSFSEHARHISDGFSCSTCHVAHGMGAQNGSVSGERLVNFDVSVVGPNGAAPIAYNRATNSCTLACHGHAHTAIAALGASPAGRLKRSAP